MITLTLCTSTPQGSLTLSREGQVLAEKVWLKEKSHSEKITTEIQALYQSVGLQIHETNLLICTKGPGSFTGIRVGLSVIKTLAYAYNIPVIAIDDGLALAANAQMAASPIPIAVMIDAQKNKVFLAVYKFEKNELIPMTSPTLAGFEELAAFLPEKQYLCLGDGFLNFNEFFPKNIAQKLTRDSKIPDLPIAKTIFSYVFPLKNTFSKLNGPNVEPLYLRSSAAEEVWDAKNKPRV
jgi:tRNA threonylcarbamoyladenosine biosynthesis protein TsaB